MLDHPQLRRVICAHTWSSVSEWAMALDALAECSEQEIELLAQGKAVKDIRREPQDH